MRFENEFRIEIFPNGFLECNTVLLYSEKSRAAWVIDPGEESSPLLGLLDERRLKLQFILHTHAHLDHAGASARLRNELGIPMALHEDDAEVYANLGLQGWMFDRPVDPPGTVDLFFRDNREFRFQGHAGTLVLETRHTPGHSPGSCCFFTSSMEAPVCFTGDTLFRRSIGRTDLPGGDPGRIVPSIRARLLNLPPETVVYPGHGPITTIGEERLENPFMTA